MRNLVNPHLPRVLAGFSVALALVLFAGPVASFTAGMLVPAVGDAAVEQSAQGDSASAEDAQEDGAAASEEETSESALDASGQNASIQLGSLDASAFTEGLFAQLDEYEASEGSLSASFMQEVSVLDSATAVYVSPSGTVMGLEFPGTLDAVRIWFVRQIEDVGWSEVPSGDERIASFTKDVGTYRWMAVRFSQGANTSMAIMTLDCSALA